MEYQLKQDHVSDNRCEARKRRVNQGIVNGQHRCGFSSSRTTLFEPCKRLKRIRHAGGYEFLACAPAEHSDDSVTLVVDADAQILWRAPLPGK